MGVAFFISPTGQLVDVSLNHINTVILNPETFGLTLGEIQAAYDKYQEKIPIEGLARQELLKRVISSDWIRIRRYKNHYSVNAKDLSDSVKERLRNWAREMLVGINGSKEKDLYMPVQISTVEGQAGCIIGRSG